MHCLIANSLPEKPRFFIEKQYYIYLLVFLLKMLVRYDFSNFFLNIFTFFKLYSNMITFLYFNSNFPTVFPMKQTTWKKWVHASSKNALKSIQRFLFLFFNPLNQFHRQRVKPCWKLQPTTDLVASLSSSKTMMKFITIKNNSLLQHNKETFKEK